MLASSSTSLLPSEPLPWRPSTRPKLPPGALLDIDQGPLWDLFTEWLLLEDICHLDSALCQKRRRAEFLALLATPVVLFLREEIQIVKITIKTTHKSLGTAKLMWILKRGIHLATLCLDEDGDASTLEAVASLALNGRLDKLERIHLYSCSYIKDADLAGILSKCYRSVKDIDIEGCGLAESAAAYIKRCTKLEAFFANGNESAADILEIVQSCRKLRKIYLDTFGELTDDVVQSVAAHCPLLGLLSLCACTAVSDAAVRRVAESCPLLQWVSLSYTKITNESVVWLCQRCPLLTEVYLHGCELLTDAAVLAVADRLPGLTRIGLYDNTSITSSAVETLASKCRALEHINLSQCSNISDVTLMKIAEHCSKLKELYVGWCFRVTAAGLTEIGLKCSHLETVTIDHEVDKSAVASLKQMFAHVNWKT